MDDDNGFRKQLLTDVYGSAPRGRPRLGWGEVVKRDPPHVVIERLASYCPWYCPQSEEETGNALLDSVM